MKKYMAMLTLTVLTLFSSSSLTLGEDIDPLNYLVQEIQLSVLHDGITNVDQWRRYDYDYLTRRESKDINNEIHLLKQEITKLSTEYATLGNGTRIYGHSQVEWVDTLLSAIVRRQAILTKSPELFNNKLAFIGSTSTKVRSKSTSPSNESIVSQTKAVIDALSNQSLPKELVTNLDIYISPYELEGILGYAHTSSLEGRDEEIVIASRESTDIYKNTYGTVIHELGHILYYDTIGLPEREPATYLTQNMKQYRDLLSLYDASVSQDSVSQSHAEHFKMYILGPTYTFSSNYINQPKTVEFIQNQLSTYAPPTNRITYDITINDQILVQNNHITSYVNTFTSPLKIDNTTSELYIDVRDKSNNRVLRNYSLINPTEEMVLAPGDYNFQLHNKAVILTETRVHIN